MGQAGMKRMNKKDPQDKKQLKIIKKRRQKSVKSQSFVFIFHTMTANDGSTFYVCFIQSGRREKNRIHIQLVAPI